MLPKRYKDVGKMIGGCLYIHKQYTNHSGDDFNIVKIAPSYTSFIFSPDFDTADEPQIISSYNTNGKIWKAPASGVIYHHKWLFVKDDYKGFNVEESKARSAAWIKIMSNNPHLKYSLIGSKTYWEQNVLSLIN